MSTISTETKLQTATPALHINYPGVCSLIVCSLMHNATPFFRRFVMSTMTETTALMGLEFSTTSSVLCLIILSRDMSLVMLDIMGQLDRDHLQVFCQINKT